MQTELVAFWHPISDLVNLFVQLLEIKDGRSNVFSVGGGGLDGSIFSHITSVENLFVAWREFKKDKTKKTDVIEFAYNLEDNIFTIQNKLLAQDWQCCGYKRFSINDPKPRSIHKATVPDRVL